MKQALKDELKELLRREPSCSLLSDGRYMADYFKYGARATEFVAGTEDEAMAKLLEYLKKNTKEELP